jgi:hypothetical protein
MAISGFKDLSDVEAGASPSSRSDIETAYEQHAQKSFPSMHILVQECRAKDSYEQQHSDLRGAWEGWKLREPEVKR